jgi:hypothetical protein
MLLLARDGQRSAALAQYETCRQVLAEELGVEPGAETLALYERIRAGDLSKGGLPNLQESKSNGESFEAGSLPMASRPFENSTPRHNLPAQITPFIGREVELAELARLLADPTIRLVTILGPGGIGKTRLALEAATAQLEQFSQGVYFVSLAPLSDPNQITPTIAEALNFSFYAGGSPQQQLLDYLRQKSLLLVMDNFEHLLDGVGLVQEILQAAPAIKVLATSRERLKFSGEIVFTLEGLGVPEGEPQVVARPHSARDPGSADHRAVLRRRMPWYGQSSIAARLQASRSSKATCTGWRRRRRPERDCPTSRPPRRLETRSDRPSRPRCRRRET